MAALGERDLRRILGDQYNATIDTGPAAEILRRKRQREDTSNDRKFTAFAAIVMGAGLVISALYTATGTTFLIQNAVAAVLIVAGVAWYVTAVKGAKRGGP